MLCLEFYCGVGSASWTTFLITPLREESSPDISTGQYFASNTPYIQYFFQPQLGVRNKNLEVSYALRFNWVHYSSYYFLYEQFDPITA